MSRMRAIHLHGAIGKEFVERIDLEVATVGEAVRALCANFPGIYEKLRDGTWHIVRGKDIGTGLSLGEEDINEFRLGNGDLHIVPAVRGSKNSNGLLKVVIGVALVGIGFFMGGFAAPLLAGASGTGVLGLTYGHLMLFGASLALGGASQLLAPEEKSEEDTESSYQMSGPGNVYDQGYPVPLVYGEVITGSVMISAGVDVEKIAVGDPDPLSEDEGEQPGWPTWDGDMSGVTP